MAATTAVAAALVVWVLALRDVDIRQVNDLGLASVLPVSVYLAVVLVTISFCLTLVRGAPRTWLVLLHLIALVVMLYGASSAIAQIPTFNISWRHAGITDYILRTGQVEPQIDAYFNWPGFFFLTAIVTDLAGLENALGLVKWAPVFFNLLYLPPLVMIARSAAADERLVWAAVWVFFLTNWVGQDYLAPQALSYFMYLALVAVLLTWFRRSAPAVVRRPRWMAERLEGLRAWAHEHDDEPSAAPRPAQLVALLLACVAIIAVTAGSHQLTPFAMLAGVGALVLLGRCSARGLPTIAAVLILAWISYMTLAYLAGHIEELRGQVGELRGAVGSNVSGRVAGSPDHTLVVSIRIGMTGLLWLAAGVGIFRALRRGRHASLAALAVAPFVLIGLNAYGGEVLLRIYLFALPFVAFFVATLLPLQARPRQAATALLALSAVLLAGFVFTRYGNERLALFTPGDVQTVEQLYRIAEPGAVLVAPSPNLPWQSEGYARYKYHTLTKNLPAAGDGAKDRDAVLERRMTAYMQSTKTNAYLVITRSIRSFDALFPGRWGSVAALERVLSSSPQFTTLYEGRDGRIFALADRQPGAPR
ncbi:MAG: hypothetical protein H0U84_08635 [Thermoleophilaceae bacterium]|nr:hypothetical protein [Thermoleophilaceae bacterium]